MIVPTLAKMIAHEHRYKPIRGKVLCLGRQTISMTPQEAIAIIKKEKIRIPPQLIEETLGTVDNSTRYGKNTGRISDVAFFKLLGIEYMEVMDVSDYEDADIIHDLNYPIPDSLKKKYDYIIDGGTFDHLFDLKTAFKNLNLMLKDDGRFLAWNAASNFTGGAYISFGPDFYFDYLMLNKFAYTKVWVVEIKDIAQRENWKFYEFEGLDKYTMLNCKNPLMTVVIGEKNKDTTYDKLPIQAQYRDNELWDSYQIGRKSTNKSDRQDYNYHVKYGILGTVLGSIARKLSGEEFNRHNGYLYKGRF